VRVSAIDAPRRPGRSGPDQPRPSLAVRWGVWVARRRWWVLSAWAVALVASAIAYPHLMSSLVPSDYSVTGSDSSKVTHLMETQFPAAGAEQDVIVFDSATLTIHDAAYRQAVARVLDEVRHRAGVVSVLGPTEPGARNQVSADGRAALAVLGLSGSDRQRADRTKHIQDAVAAAAAGGQVQAYLTGYSPSANDITEVENADVERAESFGIPVAFIVLLLALAAVVAASIPLLTAVVSLTGTLGVLAILVLALGFEADAFLLSIVTMIGVGVSIDYSLFILSRFREELVRARQEESPEPVPHAVGVAMTTSGRTIAFSATIVIISLFSLFLVNSPLFRGIALGAVLVVACTLLTAWTMLPALLGALGDRVNRWGLPSRWQPAEAQAAAAEAAGTPHRPSGWERWARTVLAHPWLAAPAAALLILFALPTLGLKVGIDLGMAALSEKPSGKAAAILERSFSPGVMSPVQIVASHQGSGRLSASDLTAIDQMTRSLAGDRRVADVYSISVLLRETGGQVSPQALAALEEDPQARTLLAQTVNVGGGSDRTIITVVPSAPVDSTQATELVEELRGEIIPRYTAGGGPQMLVGGETAQFKDLGEEALGKLPWVLALVLSLSFCYLLVIFRSLLIPLKAVLMNLLATAAAFGLTTWVFQDGHLSGLFGFTSVGFLQVYLPIIVFALLFGLSMDYEVFLIRRMQEEWLKTHDNEDAIATGIAHTARPIVAAAAIMAAVFGCFLLADVLELKEFGFALAAAVILDATIVRLLLVPAIMKLAGPWNWWLPAPLARVLPRVRVD
jgi:putative drug exporter of the RND superfamily